MSKNSKYQTHEKPKRPNRRTRCQGTLSDFFYHPLLQSIKKLKGGPFEGKNFEVSQCRKKLKGGPFSLARYCILRGKYSPGTEKKFGP